MRIGDALQRPSLRFPRPERLRRVRKREVADAIAGRRRRDTRHRGHRRHELRRLDRQVKCEQAAKVMAHEMALSFRLDRLADLLRHRIDGSAGDFNGGRLLESLEHGSPDVRTARVGRDARHAAGDEDDHATDSTQRRISALKRSGCSRNGKWPAWLMTWSSARRSCLANIW